ncbi:MAG: hypothetical protein ACE5IM_00235, partial [Nitrospinota bacterium]
MDHRVDHWIVGILSFFILTVLAVSGDVESRLPPLKKAAAGPVRAAKRAGCAACHLPGAFGDSGMRGDGEDAALGGGCAGCHTAGRDEPDAWEREGGLVPRQQAGHHGLELVELRRRLVVRRELRRAAEQLRHGIECGGGVVRRALVALNHRGLRAHPF